MSRAIYNPANPPNVVDFTVYKLQQMILRYQKTHSPKLTAFEKALELYMHGELLIEWIGGHPCAVAVSPSIAQDLIDAGGVERSYEEYAEATGLEGEETPYDPDNPDF